MWISKKRFIELNSELMTLRGEVAFDEKRVDQDEVQKTAWRLVRSAFDRMSGEGRGAEKLLWCVDAIKKVYPALGSDAEDYIRSAYVNFKIERGTP